MNYSGFHGCQELLVTAEGDPVALQCNAYFLKIEQETEGLCKHKSGQMCNQCGITKGMSAV
jgi:hypothetical protein